MSTLIREEKISATSNGEIYWCIYQEPDGGVWMAEEIRIHSTVVHASLILTDGTLY